MFMGVGEALQGVAEWGAYCQGLLLIPVDEMQGVHTGTQGCRRGACTSVSVLGHRRHRYHMQHVAQAWSTVHK